MNLYLRLAWRNIWRHRRRTIIIVLSIGLSMALMIFYDGMMAGFEQAIYGNAIKVLGGNIQIHAIGYQLKASSKPLLPLENDQTIIDAALKEPQVLAATRRINTGGLISNRAGSFAISIIAIEPEKEMPVSLLAQHVTAGQYLTASDQDVIFMGKGLADAMEVTIGDRITLAGSGSHNQMRQRTMTVGGIYDVGMPDIERQSVYISLAEAQSLYGLEGKATEIVLTLKQIGDESAVIDALKPNLVNCETASWQTNFPELQAAVNTKGGVMNVFGVIIMVIAGIGILNQLLMAVYERTREIGVLGAMGMKPGQISLLFILEGALIGLIGLVAGVALGLLINGFIGTVGIDYSKFSGLTEYTALITGRVYTTLGLDKLFQRGLTVLIIAVLSSLYPAREAAQNEPAKALHYV